MGKVDLKECPTRIEPLCVSKEEFRAKLAEQTKELIAIQEVFYAAGRYSMLVIVQGMDGSGKDSVVKHVMSGVNPQGCHVSSFKRPSAEELAHDFLWRTTCRLPERGRIGIFNRSYYEEVLIARVHPDILLHQNLPDALRDDDAIWTNRFESINDFERHLHRNGTVVVKIFLHLSREEQRRRFLKRLDKPEKNWKFDVHDAYERKFWKQYLAAYEECLNATSEPYAPWHIVPADDKGNAHMITSRILLDALKKLDLSYPKPDAKRLRELEEVRKELER